VPTASADVNPVADCGLEEADFLVEFEDLGHGSLFFSIHLETGEYQLLSTNLNLLLPHNLHLQTSTLPDIMAVPINTRIHFEQLRPPLQRHVKANQHPNFSFCSFELPVEPLAVFDHFYVLAPPLCFSDSFDDLDVFEHGAFAVDPELCPLPLLHQPVSPLFISHLKGVFLGFIQLISPLIFQEYLVLLDELLVISSYDFILTLD